MRKSFLSALLVVFVVAAQAVAPIEVKLTGERRIQFNDGWRFAKEDPSGAEKPDFPDSAWRSIDLPHDWAIEGPFDKKYSPNCGGLPFFGVAW